VLDYTTNLDDHCPDGDLFAPLVRAKKVSGEGTQIEVCCPDCQTVQLHTMRGDMVDDHSKWDAAGYLLDLMGNQVMGEHGPIPAHYGRRCVGLIRTGQRGEYQRCDYRWTSKICETCGEHNDIAARYCSSCKAELVNPNDKLVADFKALKRDPTMIQTDDVLSIETREGVSQKGNRTVRADFVTPFRSFSVWFVPESMATMARADWRAFQAATEYGMKPSTVTYRKDGASGFYRVLGYNRAVDAAPDGFENRKKVA
jgi:DNA repair protein RadD